MQINQIGKFISEKMTSICLFLIFLSGYFNNIKSCRIAFMALVSFVLVYSLYEKFFKLEEHTEVIDSLNVMRAFANEIHATKDAYNELKEIDLNDAPLEEISPWVLGEYLGSVITNECINDIANGVAKYKALYFIPYIRFEKILAAEETVALSWLSMLKLLYPLMFSKK